MVSGKFQYFALSPVDRGGVGASFDAVRRTLEREGVEIRKRGRYDRKIPELAKLGIAGSILVPRPHSKGIPHGQFYVMAKQAGIRISIKTIDRSTSQLTRID